MIGSAANPFGTAQPVRITVYARVPRVHACMDARTLRQCEYSTVCQSTLSCRPARVSDAQYSATAAAAAQYSATVPTQRRFFNRDLNALQFLFTPEGAAAQTADEALGGRRRRKTPKVQPPTTYIYTARTTRRVQPATFEARSAAACGAGSERSATEAAGCGSVDACRCLYCPAAHLRQPSLLRAACCKPTAVARLWPVEFCSSTGRRAGGVRCAVLACTPREYAIGTANTEWSAAGRSGVRVDIARQDSRRRARLGCAGRHGAAHQVLRACRTCGIVYCRVLSRGRLGCASTGATHRVRCGAPPLHARRVLHCRVHCGGE